MTELLTIVMWLWDDPERPCRWGKPYSVMDVDRVARQVHRNLRIPHRFVCFTDHPFAPCTAASGGVPVDLRRIWPCPVGDRGRPEQGQCWRRLRAFSPDMLPILGPRFVSIDLDCVVVGDLTPLFNQPDADLVMWANQAAPGTPYNGSMWLHRTGSLPIIWQSFDPATSPQTCIEHGFIGSDQAWISYVMGPDLPKWTMADGVHHYGKHCQGHLPANARIVFAPGSEKIPAERLSGERW